MFSDDRSSIGGESRGGLAAPVLRRSTRRAFFFLAAAWLGQPSPAVAADPPFLGETLHYAMSWGPFAGGQMTIAASREISLDGHPAIKIELSAISNDFISKFFVVRDLIISWIDAHTLQSLRFEKHTVEGKRVDDERIDFDHEGRVARRDDRVIAFSPPVFDSLSAVYFLRTQSLTEGSPVELEVVSGRHAYRLVVDVLGRERVTTPAGVFDTLRVHPKMKEGLLKKEGDLWLWMTDDGRKIPVMIRSKLNFGTLTARLRSLPHTAPAPGTGR